MMGRPGRPATKVLFVGKRHGHLTISREIGRNKYKQLEYECVCDCGGITKMRTSHFVPERKYCTRSCSLLQKHKMADLAGGTFGAWSVGSYAGKKNGVFWHCMCVCGKEQAIESYVLINGESTNCGCVADLAHKKYHTPEAKLAAARAASAKSNRKNPARVKANKIRYESQLTRATPSWLTKDDWDRMNVIYKLARKLTKKTGIRHEVDHVIPLNGKVVSGLHVPGNLQILTQSENVAKSNRYAELSGD